MPDTLLGTGFKIKRNKPNKITYSCFLSRIRGQEINILRQQQKALTLALVINMPTIIISILYLEYKGTT